MKCVKLLAGSALLLSGCTNTISPVSYEVASTVPRTEFCAAQPSRREEAASFRPSGGDNVPPARGNSDRTSLQAEREQLRWYVCELRRRANANANQSAHWANRQEWRDIPLMAAALTVAGILLFGKRDDNNLTSGEQEAIAIAGFGAAGWATFLNYLSPSNARALLRTAAKGHFCMATQGELILSLWVDVLSAEREVAREALPRHLRALDASITAAPADTPRLAEFTAIRNAGYEALALFDLQKRELGNAHVHVGEAAWKFGIDLMQRSDRQAVDVANLIQSISDQTASVTRFGAVPTPGELEAPSLSGPEMVSLARAGGAAGIEANAADVAASRRALLAGLPNVEALGLGFDSCAATALAGGDPRAVRIQRISPN